MLDVELAVMALEDIEQVSMSNGKEEISLLLSSSTLTLPFRVSDLCFPSDCSFVNSKVRR